MPVYGLPSALESSLNSLAGVRPPTSWRVSGHGDDITVILRWAECSSPSSDKTLHYDIDHNPKDRLQESDWRQFQGNILLEAQDVYPRSSGSVHSTTSAKMETDALRMRYSKTLPRRRHRVSPVPMILSSSTSMSQKAPQNPEPPRTAVAAYADMGNRSSVVSANSHSSLASVDEGSRCSSGCESVGNCSSSSVADGSAEGSRHESEMRNGIRAYLNQEIEIDKAEDRAETASPANNFRSVSQNSTSSNSDSQRSKTQTDENTQRSSGSCSPQILSEHSGSHLLICQPDRNDSPRLVSPTEQPITAVKSKVVDEGQSTRAFKSVSCNQEARPETTRPSGDKTFVQDSANDAAVEDIPSFDLDMACSAEMGQGDKDDEANYPDHYYWDKYDPLNDTEDLINVEIQADSPLGSISDEM